MKKIKIFLMSILLCHFGCIELSSYTSLSDFKGDISKLDKKLNFKDKFVSQNKDDIRSMVGGGDVKSLHTALSYSDKTSQCKMFDQSCSIEQVESLLKLFNFHNIYEANLVSLLKRTQHISKKHILRKDLEKLFIIILHKQVSYIERSLELEKALNNLGLSKNNVDKDIVLKAFKTKKNVKDIAERAIVQKAFYLLEDTHYVIPLIFELADKAKQDLQQAVFILQEQQLLNLRHREQNMIEQKDFQDRAMILHNMILEKEAIELKRILIRLEEEHENIVKENQKKEYKRNLQYFIHSDEALRILGLSEQESVRDINSLANIMIASAGKDWKRKFEIEVARDVLIHSNQDS